MPETVTKNIKYKQEWSSIDIRNPDATNAQIKSAFRDKLLLFLNRLNSDFEDKEGTKLWDDSPDNFVTGSVQNVFDFNVYILKHFSEFSDIDLIVNVKKYDKLVNYLKSNPEFKFLSNSNKAYKEDNKYRFMSVILNGSDIFQPFGSDIKIDFIFVEFDNIDSEEFKFSKFINGYSPSDAIYSLGAVSHKLLLRALTNKISEFESFTINESTLRRIIRNNKGDKDKIKAEISLNSKFKKDRYLKLSYKGLRTIYITLNSYLSNKISEESYSDLAEILLDNPHMNFIRVKLSRKNIKSNKNLNLIFQELIDNKTFLSFYKLEQFASFVGVLRLMDNYLEPELMISIIERFIELKVDHGGANLESAIKYIEDNCRLDKAIIGKLIELTELTNRVN